MLPNTNNSVKQFQEFNYTWNKRSLCDILKIKLTKLSSYIRIYHIAFLHFFFLIILVNLFFFWLDWNVLKKKKKKKKERKKEESITSTTSYPSSWVMANLFREVSQAAQSQVHYFHLPHFARQWATLFLFFEPIQNYFPFSLCLSKLWHFLKIA